MGALADLPNIGGMTEKNLIEAGIDTPEKLFALGAKDAFMRVRTVDPGA